MRVLAALLGLLILAPAAHAATYKVSAYGVERLTLTSSVSSTGRCFDERGSERTEIVSRFKTPRALRARLLEIGPAATLVPIGNRDLKLSVSVERKASGTMEKASCADLNPDGSPKWVAKEPEESCSATFDDYTASISFDGRVAEFHARTPFLASLTCPEPSIASVKKRITMRQIAGSIDTPIRIQSRSDEVTTAPDGSSSSSIKRLTTVYLQFRRIG